MALYIGLMSGTSLDGVDGVLAEWVDDPGSAPALRVVAHHHAGFDEPLREELLRLNRSGADELHRAALAANALARSYAMASAGLLEACGRHSSEVRAIGAHGQTVRHRPQAFDGTGYTLQLLNGALLAELAGVDVVCDLRSRDVAAGGQGAPLVPAFHAAAFGAAGRDVAVLNLGGISNLTLLRADSTVGGFDCGPGNVLLDLWCHRHRGVAYDEAGRWAATGRVDAALLGRLLAEPYLAAPPPKSTGRDLFNAEWLAAALGADGARLPPEDVQATLAEFTARAAADGLRRHAPAVTELLLCGGGARNIDLVGRLRAALPACRVDTTDARGVPAEQVEALAFAWLARAFVERRPGNLPAVTGARGPRLLGALHPA
jgi:anhydro-N-acetylmuramic acid kinase